jgi:hypothetical protein
MKIIGTRIKTIEELCGDLLLELNKEGLFAFVIIKDKEKGIESINFKRIK